MKILVISDTHRRDRLVEAIWQREAPCDLVLCAGDAEGSEADFAALVAPAPFLSVRGNNDFFADLPEEREIPLGPFRCLLTHGHRYHVSLSEDLLVEEARARGDDIMIYGHTHRPVLHREQGILVCNPGSVGWPRQEGRLSSYLILDLAPDGMLSARIHYLEGGGQNAQGA